jgi:hypothetical protein
MRNRFYKNIFRKAWLINHEWNDFRPVIRWGIVFRSWLFLIGLRGRAMERRRGSHLPLPRFRRRMVAQRQQALDAECRATTLALIRHYDKMPSASCPELTAGH